MRRALLVLALLVVPAVAQARASVELTYRYEAVWASMIRMLRVDLRCPIEDRDQEIGFVLFGYVDRGREYPGSVELVRMRGEGLPRVRVTVQVPGMPSYVSRMIADRLVRKLLEDYGEPPTPPRRSRDDQADSEDPPAHESGREPEGTAPRQVQNNVADRNGLLPGERRRQRVVRE